MWWWAVSGWWRLAVGGWRLVAVGGWGLVLLEGCPCQKKFGVLGTVTVLQMGPLGPPNTKDLPDAAPELTMAISMGPDLRPPFSDARYSALSGGGGGGGASGAP